MSDASAEKKQLADDASALGFPQLLTVRQVEEALGTGVRHLIAVDLDGFDTECVVRLGRAVRIRVDRLAEWIDKNTGTGPTQYNWTAKSGPKPVHCGRPSKEAKAKAS